MVNLKKLRSGKKITQTELAKAVGCTQTHISDIEQGLANASTALANQIADELKVSLDELFGREPPNVSAA